MLIFHEGHKANTQQVHIVCLFYTGSAISARTITSTVDMPSTTMTSPLPVTVERVDVSKTQLSAITMNIPYTS